MATLASLLKRFKWICNKAGNASRAESLGFSEADFYGMMDNYLRRRVQNARDSKIAMYNSWLNT